LIADQNIKRVLFRIDSFLCNAQTGLFIDGDKLQTQRRMIATRMETTLQPMGNQSPMTRRLVTASPPINHR
jgi:hypothetical protein